jgi:hypothetical protein
MMWEEEKMQWEIAAINLKVLLLRIAKVTTTSHPFSREVRNAVRVAVRTVITQSYACACTSNFDIFMHLSWSHESYSRETAGRTHLRFVMIRQDEYKEGHRGIIISGLVWR